MALTEDQKERENKINLIELYLPIFKNFMSANSELEDKFISNNNLSLINNQAKLNRILSLIRENRTDRKNDDDSEGENINEDGNIIIMSES